MNTPTEGFNLGRTTRMVLKLKNDIGRGLKALGENIQIVKENLPSKEYLDWLKYDVGIHRATAFRYMKIAKQVDYKTLEKLGPTKVFEILEAPMTDDEKHQLMERAENMTVREVREVTHTPKTNIEEVIITDPSDIPKEYDQAVNMGIDLAEHLDTLEPETLAENWKLFVKSQLTVVEQVVRGFINRL